MSRKLSPEDQSLWDRVAATVRRLGGDHVLVPMPAPSVIPMRYDPSPVLDLHGYTVNDAHKAALKHIDDMARQGTYRYVTIITGLSGSICEEFPRWLENHKDVRSVKALRGGGAFEVWLRKKGTSTRKS